MRNEDLHCAQTLVSAVVILGHFFLDLLFDLAVAHALEAAHYLFEFFHAVMEMDSQRHEINEDDSHDYNESKLARVPWLYYINGSGVWSICPRRTAPPGAAEPLPPPISRP